MIQVSILMCVYNGEFFLSQAIESILKQTFNNFEFIIVDDGSTDRTLHIISEYAKQDSRIVLVYNEKNLGLEKSLNKGLSVAKGKYFARQDADDISLPNRLELQTHFLDNHPEVGALGTAVKLIDEQGDTFGEDYLPTDHESLQSLLLVNNFMHHSTLMVRRSLMQKLGGYDEDMRYTEDYDLWWRLSKLSNLATLPNTLLYRRMDNGSRISKLYREKQLQNALNISLRGIRESMKHDSSSLNQEAYQRLWWAYHKLLDRESYQRFWLEQYGQDALLQSKDIAKLLPFWNFLKTFPGGSQIWGSRLRELAHDFLRNRQIFVGLHMLWVVVYRLNTSIKWGAAIRALVKPYIPSFGQKFWIAWKLKQVET